MKFCELQEAEFRTFLDRHPLKSFVQTPEMAQYKKNHGWEVSYVGMKEQDKILCATMMVSTKNAIGKRMFYAPNGYLIDFENKELLREFTKEIKAYIKRKKGYTLVIDPYYPLKERDINGDVVPNGFDHTEVIQKLKDMGYHYRGTSDQVKYMFVLDVENKTEKELLSKMSSNAKRSIQKSLKDGIVFREIGIDELETFKSLTASSGERHNFSDRSLDYYKEMYQILHPKGLVQFVVGEIHFNDYIKGNQKEIESELEKIPKLKETDGKRKDSEAKIEQLKRKNKEALELQEKYGDTFIISGGMFITYGDEVIYLFGGNLKEYMHFNTAYRVQWEMIQYALHNNYKRYNFYGILSTDENDGVYKFKKGFNGYVVELIGEFELPISSFYYIRKFIKRILKR